MKDHRIVGVRRGMRYSDGFNVAPIGRARCLSLWWDDSVQVEMIDSSKHFIDAKCDFVYSQCVFRFTRVYRTSYRAEKAEFWRGMIQKFDPDSIPWICGGDFNELLWGHKKSGGAEVGYNRPRYLEEFMCKLEIMDLGFNDPKFTWRGTRNGQLVKAQLDKGLVNESWQSLWPNTIITNGTCPVLVQCGLYVRKKKKLFHSEAFWAKDAECK
ncbi:hypothetical protein ACFXTN_029871 [Malus domestica]